MTTQPVGAADLASLSLFVGLPDDELAALAAVASRRRLADGEVLFEQGEPAATLYHVIVGGLVLRAGADGREVIVDTLGPGDLLGWSAIGDDARTLSTARATGDTELIEVPVEPIVNLAAGASRQARVLLKRLLGIAAGHLQASRAQLLQVGGEGVITAG
jgi:CRP-like cAMP-binding protein